jgi:hypothetical protein
MRELKQRVVTDLSPAALWRVLSDFGGVHHWAPGMRSCQLIGKQSKGVGTRRRMRHRWGFPIEETVTGWAEGQGLSFILDLAPFPMRDVSESWWLNYDGERVTINTTVAYEMGLGPIGRLLDHFLVRFLVEREMSTGLEAFLEYARSEASANAAEASLDEQQESMADRAESTAV